MNSETHDDLVFNATASCAIGIAASVFAAVMYRLITIAAPLLQSITYVGIVR